MSISKKWQVPPPRKHKDASSSNLGLEAKQCLDAAEPKWRGHAAAAAEPKWTERKWTEPKWTDPKWDGHGAAAAEPKWTGPVYVEPTKFVKLYKS